MQTSNRELKRTLLKKAKEQLLSRGVTDFSLAELAHAAGISLHQVSTLYSSEEELLREILREGFEEANAVFVNVMQRRGKPDLKLNRLVRELLQVYDANVLLYKILATNFQNLGEEKLKLRRLLPERAVERYHENTKLIAQLISRGQSESIFSPRVEPLHAAYILRGMINAAIFYWESKGRRAPLSQLTEPLTRILLKGLYR